MQKDRFEEILEGIDSSVAMQLEQIRRHLRRGKASVMVGAGFSKNAIMDEGTRMLDWGELCSLFHKELYGKEAGDSELRLKSALRLAQQVESVKGRNALEELIKESLPNDSITPGYLHELLVGLDWRDIFTTNYDTLIEDAAVRVCKHYNVVTSKNSLVYQPHPRIVKVHGSFPDNRPFIITEEDYRTYPALFPEFVNTVRQALIETQFVLLGFSGDDPNFLAWLGWFRDIMGSRMLPVYLIHIGAMPHVSEVQLMGKRGIQLIPTTAFSSDVNEALDFILSFLGDIHTPTTQWNGSIAYKRSISDLSLSELTDEMRRVRQSYPGWFILPSDFIPNFADTWEIFPFLGHKFNELTDTAQKIEFLYELDWRLTISFMPKWIEDEWYSQALEWVDSIFDSLSGDLREYAVSLSLSLLHIYRERMDNGFNELFDKIKSRDKLASSSISHRLNYERSVRFLQSGEFKECLTLLNEWNVNPEDYRSVLWKTRLMFETGNPKEANMLLQQSIDNVRRKLLRHSSNYHSSVLTILKKCADVANGDMSTKDLSNPNLSFREYYDLTLKEIRKENNPNIEKIHGFNIGNTSTTWNSGEFGYIRKYLGAARYYEIAEAYGYPVGSIYGTVNSEINKLALPLILKLNVSGATGLLVESNDEKAFESTFSRGAIMNDINPDIAETLFDSYFEIFKKGVSQSESEIAPRITNIIVPLLSRLCTQIKPEKVFEFAKELINLHGYRVIDIDKYLRTVYNSLPIADCNSLWWEILNRPIKFNYLHKDYLLPPGVIDMWEGDEEITHILIKALKSDDMEIMQAGMSRLESVYVYLPEHELREVDSLIALKWDQLKDTGIVNFLGVQDHNIIDKPWHDLFLTYLNREFEDFRNIEITQITNSEKISQMEHYLALFIDCRNYLDADKYNQIISEVLDFIRINEDSILKDDSHTLLGGIRRFWNELMRLFNIFISSIDLRSIEPRILADLKSALNYLSTQYPFAQSYISLLTKDSGNSSKIEKGLFQRVRNFLELNMNTDSDSRIHDSFLAVRSAKTNTNNRISLRPIVDEVVNRFHYIRDDISLYYLQNLPIWIKSGVISGNLLSKLLKALFELLNRIYHDKEMSEELKADFLYYLAEMVGFLNIMRNDPEFASFNEDILRLEDTWEEMSDINHIPADIQKGFFFGEADARFHLNQLNKRL